ncbi:MAG: GAF domain-containing protein [Melioribacteraceae bacterium]|nr:GAF domain-containing protein [Melioribacteraceae bacterium]
MENLISIVILTNNSSTRHIYETFKTLGNFELIFLTRAAESLKTLKTLQISSIFVELDQPMMSEVDFVSELRGSFPSLKIFVVSEFFRETQENVFGNKINGFISKPLSLDKLYKTLEIIRENAENEISDDDENKIENHPLVEENKRLSILFEISKCLVSIKDFDQLLKSIVEQAKDALSAERATLFLLDEENNELWSREGTGIGQKEIRFPASMGIAGEVVTKKEPIITNSPYSHPKFNKEFDQKTGFHTNNLICVPLINLNGKTLGAFQILNVSSENFSSDDISFANSLATSTAIALENILLNEKNEKTIEETEKLYQDLYQSQNALINETKRSIIFEIKNEIASMISEPEASKISQLLQNKLYELN